MSVGGTLLAFALVFTELALHILKKYGRDHQSCMEEFAEEIKFYFRFKGMVKPAKVKKADTQSVDSKEKLGTTEGTPVSIGFTPEIVHALPDK